MTFCSFCAELKVLLVKNNDFGFDYDLYKIEKSQKTSKIQK